MSPSFKPYSSLFDSKIIDDRLITVQTLDKIEFRERVYILLQCNFFKEMYKNLLMYNMEDTNPNFIFPVGICSKQFEKIIIWCKNHVDSSDVVVLENEETKEREWFWLNEFQTNFLNVPVEELKELIITANYLDLPSLYLYGCQKMAEILMQQTPEESRKILGHNDDLNADEKEKLKRAYSWLYKLHPQKDEEKDKSCEM